MKEVSVRETAEHMADYRDCLELAGAIAESVESYGSDDLMEVIVPHLRPVIGKLEALEAVAGELAGALSGVDEFMSEAAQSDVLMPRLLVHRIESALAKAASIGIYPNTERT